jgi:hypothetical protein
MLIERQLRRRGLRLPADRRILWELPDLMVRAFGASPDGTATSFDRLRLAVEALAATGGPAPLIVTEAEFNKVKSILLHARAFTLLGRDRGISLQVADTAHLRSLIVGQLLRHLADPADEEPVVLAEAFFGPSATAEQQDLVAAVLRAVPAEPATADPAAVIPAPREAGSTADEASREAEAGPDADREPDAADGEAPASAADAAGGEAEAADRETEAVPGEAEAVSLEAETVPREAS